MCRRRVDRAQSVAELNYRGERRHLTLPAYGEVAGVATNSRGHIFVYARTGHAVATLGDERTFYHGGSRLFQFDPSGKFVREIGQGTYGFDFAQQVRIDPQDNIWAVDAGSNVLTKFDSEGRFLMVIGRKPESIPVRQGPGVPARILDDPPAGAPAPATGRRRWWWWRRRGRKGASRRRHAQRILQPADRHRVRQRGQRLHRRRNGQQQSHRGVQPRRQLGDAAGDKPDRARASSTRSAGLSAMPPAISTWRMRATTAFRSSTAQGTFKSQITGIGSPQAICITGGSPQYLYSSNSNDPESMDNGEIYKISTRRTSRWQVRQGRKSSGRVRHGQFARLPHGEYAVGRRGLELAGAESDVEAIERQFGQRPKDLRDGNT